MLAVHIRGKFCAESLQRAMRLIVQTHGIFRTAFGKVAGLKVPLQFVSGEPSLTWTEHGGVRNWQQVFATRRAESPPLGEGAISCDLVPASGNWILIIAVPPLWSDAGTLITLFQELASEYQQFADGSLPKPQGDILQYADYADWQLAFDTERENVARSKAWFLEHAAGEAMAPLPEEKFGADLATACRERRSYFVLPSGLEQGLARLGGGENPNVPSFLLTCWRVLLRRLSGEERLALGVCNDGRHFEQLASLCGPLSKCIPISQSVLPNQTFQEVHSAAAKLEKAAGELLSFNLEAEGMKPGADVSCGVHFGVVMFPPELTCGGVSFRILEHQTWSYPSRLTLCCEFFHGRWRAYLSCKGTAFDSAALRRFAGYYKTVVRRCLSAPQTPIKDIPVLHQRQISFLAHKSSRRERTQLVDSCWLESFYAQVKRSPGSIAIVSPDAVLTYAELDSLSSRIGRAIQSLGVVVGSRVAISCARSATTIAGILAIHKAGACYVPVEPDFPESYVTTIIRDAGVCLIAHHGEGVFEAQDVPLLNLLSIGRPQHVEADDRAWSGFPVCAPEDIAYILYTSGSSGAPKGVAITHRSVANLAYGLQQTVYANLPTGVRCALNAPLSFDASVKQLLTLTMGNQLYLVPEETRLDPEAFCSYLREHSINILDCTPSHLKYLIAAGLLEFELPPGSRLLLVGGEKIDEALWEILRSAISYEAINLYGPTEATVDATFCRVSESQKPSIGTPFPNVQVYIAGPDLQPAPIDVTGEIVIGGEGVAAGYLNNPELNRQRFVANPYPIPGGSLRLFRTGDLGRLRPDGTIEILGRMDRQIKHQGCRIELEEIEQVLRSYPGVEDAAVLDRENSDGSKRLAAYVVPTNKDSLQLNGFTSCKLPNGLNIACQTRHEAEYLFEELFIGQEYLSQGIELKEGDTVFDVGANIGLATLFFHLACANLHIYAFEPLPTLFQILSYNLRTHCGNAEAIPFGASDRDETAEMDFYPDYSIMSSRFGNSRQEEATVRQFILNGRRNAGICDDPLLEHLDEFLEGRFASQKVRCRFRPLSDFILERGIDRIDLLKLDVQKSELSVLRGIVDSDWQKIRQVVAEVHDFDSNIENVSTLLKARDYNIEVHQNPVLHGTDRFHVVARRQPTFAIKKSELPQIRAVPTPLVTTGELRSHLRQTLPPFMQPSSFVLVKRIELTKNGKLDRQAMARHEAAASACSDMPVTETERKLVAIWKELFRTEQIGINDNFFDLGGNSILQIQFVAKARGVGLHLLPRDVFASPTVQELGCIADRNRISKQAGEGVTECDFGS